MSWSQEAPFQEGTHRPLAGMLGTGSWPLTTRMEEPIRRWTALQEPQTWRQGFAC